METDLIELNVGGSVYTTLRKTLLSENGSLFHDLLVTNSIEFLKDSNGRIFIDRDGNLFKYVLDYLRNKNSATLDTNVDKLKLKGEADYFKLSNMKSHIDELELKSGYITLAFRGKFHMDHHHGSHPNDFSDIKFRKISRIIVSGKVSMCREVFGEDLNESRDPDNHDEKYSSRYFLKHLHLEQAYDTLAKHNFVLVSACAFGNQNEKEQLEHADDRWLHYTELVFLKR